jgi:hypothetical protein
MKKNINYCSFLGIVAIAFMGNVYATLDPGYREKCLGPWFSPLKGGASYSDQGEDFPPPPPPKPSNLGSNQTDGPPSSASMPELQKPRKRFQRDDLPPGCLKDPSSGQVYRTFVTPNGTYVEEYSPYGITTWSKTHSSSDLFFEKKSPNPTINPIMKERMKKIKLYIRQCNPEGLLKILRLFRKPNRKSNRNSNAEDFIRIYPDLLLYALATYGKDIQLSDEEEEGPEERVIRILKNFGYRKKYSLFI